MAGRDDDDEGDDDDNGEVAGGESSGASNSQSVSRLSSENIFLFLIVLLSFLLRSPDVVTIADDFGVVFLFPNEDWPNFEE